MHLSPSGRLTYAASHCCTVETEWCLSCRECLSSRLCGRLSVEGSRLSQWRSGCLSTLTWTGSYLNWTDKLRSIWRADKNNLLSALRYLSFASGFIRSSFIVLNNVGREKEKTTVCRASAIRLPFGGSVESTGELPSGMEHPTGASARIGSSRGLPLGHTPNDVCRSLYTLSEWCIHGAYTSGLCPTGRTSTASSGLIYGMCAPSLAKLNSTLECAPISDDYITLYRQCLLDAVY